MPVTLSRFDVVCNNSGAKLNWQTLTEQNSSSFDVERSNTGTDGWSTIASLAAAGNSSAVKSYEFTDLKGDGSFYRLRQVDKDGNTTYSAVQKANCAKQADLSIYPIPAKDIMNVVIGSDRNSRVTLVLVDLAGKVVKQMVTELQRGSNKITLDVKQLGGGEYFLKVIGTDVSKTQKVSVMK
jgi:hypothetical protein